jgi:hypothetical protein
MTPELIDMVSWILKECSHIAKTIIIPGNHDFLVNNTDRLDALSPIIDSLNNKNIVYYKPIANSLHLQHSIFKNKFKIILIRKYT